MKISGSKIKDRRKTIGLSQSELADEICTQATISLIEKKNKVPSMEILISICDRLELSVNSVIIEDSTLVGGLLKNAEKNFYDQNLSNLATNISKVDENKLSNNQELRQYYYFKAYVELKLNKNYDKAIFIYTRALNAAPRVNDLYDILINLFISEAYIGKNAMEEAGIYVEQAEKIISDNRFDTELSMNLLIIYKNISEIFTVLKNPTKAVKYAKLGIEKAKFRESYFLLDNLYIIIAELEQNKFATMSAYVFATIRQNKEIIERAKKVAQINKIELY